MPITAAPNPAIIATYGTVAGHGDSLDRMVLVTGDEAALAAADAAIAGAPTAILDTVEGYAASSAGPIDAILTMVIGFFGHAVVIAVLGIATPIGLSLHERGSPGAIEATVRDVCCRCEHAPEMWRHADTRARRHGS